MSNRFFAILIFVLVVGTGGYIVLRQNSKPKETVLGTQHTVLESKHIGRGQPHSEYNSSPASSGPHYADEGAPISWGIYTDEVPEEVFIHNQEHGGVIITHQPTLPADQLKKLQALFAPPYSNKEFKPIKAIVTPRAKNTFPIQLAGWGYTLDLKQYDEESIMKFYLQRVGKAPEAGAGPTNTPINQAGNQ